DATFETYLKNRFWGNNLPKGIQKLIKNSQEINESEFKIDDDDNAFFANVENETITEQEISFNDLTERETQIVEMLKQGVTLQEIGKKLNLSKQRIHQINKELQKKILLE
ncbi:MAG: LuxR C-terminal-related transcriptional regulator, partial [Candidatus Margulisbacteria bacterium]|nr:LuxR C-terminal-related transcriptional regulator [Candidatus Margulisiibacteriota bacterium]